MKSEESEREESGLFARDCHRAIFYTHFSSFLTSFPLHFSGLLHSILRISIPHQHTRFLSFLLPVLKDVQTSSKTMKKIFN